MKRNLYLFLIIQFFSVAVVAQVAVFSEINQMDDLRIKQITGKDSSSQLSFGIRSSSQFYQLVDSNRKFWKTNFGFEIRNIGFLTQENNKMALGSNDGSLLPSVGMQSRVNLSLALRWKRFTLQIGPEFMRAENLEQPPFQYDKGDNNYMARYYLYTVNKIDQYWRFGKQKIERGLPGQSSLRYENKKLSIGISNENLWWGPSLRNSLVLSNHADNFTHLTLNTIRPIRTKAGAFEGQVIYGTLTNPTDEHPDNELMRTVWSGGIATKDSAQRSIAAFILTWQPKWIKNLYFGLAASTTSNKSGVNSRPVSFPILTTYKPIQLGSFSSGITCPKKIQSFI